MHFEPVRAYSEIAVELRVASEGEEGGTARFLGNKAIYV
jgi:hypothetical protein